MKSTKIWLGISGVLLVILGILSIIYPTATLFNLAWMIGLFTLCSGVSKFIFAMRTRNSLPNTGMRALSGLLQIIIGIIFIGNAMFVGLSLAVVFAMWILVESVLIAVQSFDYKKAGYSGWWMMLLLGIAGMALGVAGLHNPIITGGTLSLLIGIAIVALGVAYLFGLRGIKKFEKFIEEQ